MRPATLKQAYERIISDERGAFALNEFLDTFYNHRTCEARAASLADEPPLTGEARDDAYAGAVAEYLARQYELDRVPAWALHPRRYLDEPWHVTDIRAPGMIEYLTWASPAEFRCRNIFTEECPLRRATRGAANAAMRAEKAARKNAGAA